MTAQELHRYWFEFDEPPGALATDENLEYPKPTFLAQWHLGHGVGATGYSPADALLLIRQHILDGAPAPPIRRITVDVDVSTLDPIHVLPNIGVVIWRGVWFPNVTGV